MSISPIASGASAYSPAVSATREASEPKVNGKEARADGDADDGAAGSRVAAPRVNTSGQVTGQLINISA